MPDMEKDSYATLTRAKIARRQIFNRKGVWLRVYRKGGRYYLTKLNAHKSDAKE